jgi:hypothetical protein
MGERTKSRLRIYWKNWLSVLTIYVITETHCAEWQHRFWHFRYVNRWRGIWHSIVGPLRSILARPSTDKEGGRG